MSAVPVRNSDGVAIPHLFQIGGQGFAPSPVIEAPVAPPPVVSAPAAAAPQPPDAPPTARTITAQLRARLRVVEREIRARKALEEERDSLKRLIAAAKADKTNVRRLRAAG